MNIPKTSGGPETMIFVQNQGIREILPHADS
jgi:hypothetical protein